VRPHQGVLGTIVVSQVAMATTAQMAEALTLASTTHGETSGCSECQEFARACRGAGPSDRPVTHAQTQNEAIPLTGAVAKARTLAMWHSR
jgi:hypothetical protein